MNERDKLKEEFKKLELENYVGFPYTELIDFVLKDRKRILGEIKEQLKKPSNTELGLICKVSNALEIIKKYEGDV